MNMELRAAVLIQRDRIVVAAERIEELLSCKLLSDLHVFHSFRSACRKNGKSGIFMLRVAGSGESDDVAVVKVIGL